MVQSVFITGGTRGVGLEIAKKFAASGAQVAIVGKTVTPHPKLPGTLDSAAEEIRQAGASEVLALACDVRDLEALEQAIKTAGERFGKIDLLVNNASALYLLSAQEITPSKFNLMHEVIVRGSFFATQYALPWLKKSANPRIIHLAPPIDLKPKWFAGHTAYTVCKYSSAMLVMGLAEELAKDGIAVNAVWPHTLLATAAVQNLLGGDMAVKHSRHPRIVADAVAYLVAKETSYSGHFHLDDDILRDNGVDLAQYNCVPGSKLITDLYVEE
jgi:citronellol/citronellal dehydrogenase